MFEKLGKVIDNFAFLKPESCSAREIMHSYLQYPTIREELHSIDSAVPCIDVEHSTVKLQAYELGYYKEKYLEQIILERLYEKLDQYADIFDIRAAHISNLDSRYEAAEKLDDYLLKFYTRCIYFPDMIIISQTLFNYLEASRHFCRTEFRVHVPGGADAVLGERREQRVDPVISFP